MPNGAAGTYDHASELTSSVLSGATTSYAYDADGRRLTASQGGTTLSSGSWNGADQLTSLADGAANMTAATYGGDGLRASSVITPSGGSAVANGYVWDTVPQTPRLIMDSSNAYIYTTGNVPAEQVNLSTGGITYLVTDSLGSVRGTVSSSGTLNGATNYDAWGNPQTTGGLTATTPFGFAGGYTDPGGLIYLIDRYYDPATGQFLSVDPQLGQTQQPYTYVAGNPVNGTDPTGDCPCITGGGGTSSSSAGGPAQKIAVAPGGVGALNYNSQHAVAVYTAVTDIWRQLRRHGYGPGTIARHLELERPVPAGSKKKTGNIGRADITWQIPYAGVLVWEVKIWTQKYQASREAQGYVAAFNRAGIIAATGFGLDGVIYGREYTSSQVMRVFSWGPGGILYQVINTPRPRPAPQPQPQPQPNPSPVPHIKVRWQDIILLIILGVVIRLAVVAAAA